MNKRKNILNEIFATGNILYIKRSLLMIYTFPEPEQNESEFATELVRILPKAITLQVGGSLLILGSVICPDFSGLIMKLEVMYNQQVYLANYTANFWQKVFLAGDIEVFHEGKRLIPEDFYANG